MYNAYPADMPPPVVRSPLGLPLRGSGLLPGPPALPCCWPGAYIIQMLWFIVYTNILYLIHTHHIGQLCYILQTQTLVECRKGGMASNRSTGGATPPSPGGCGVPSPYKCTALAALWQLAVAAPRATMFCRVPCPETPRPVAMHRASARAWASRIPHVFPPGPSLPAHLDACMKTLHWSILGFAPGL